METHKYRNLSVAVVALVAIAGLVVTQSARLSGFVVAQNSQIGVSNNYFESGLEVGYACIANPRYDMHKDEWRMCCSSNCEPVCKGTKKKWGLSMIAECEPNCHAGCVEGVRRNVELMPNAFS